MNRPILAAIATPVAAALLVVVLIAVLHPGALLHPNSVLHSPSESPGRQTTGHCADRSISTPFVGVAINPPIAGSAQSFSSATKVRLELVEFYTAFLKPFPQFEIEQAVGHGMLPLVQINPRGISLSRIAAGHYDPYIRQYANAVKKFGCPVVISFGHEMNGSWYSWGRPRTSPATFIAAWRHIFRVFAAEHVVNVTWSWDPDHVWQPNHGGSWASLWWPGSAYVDWIGIDGYQRPGETFNSIFSRQLANIRSFTSKPVFIAETGVQPSRSEASQISGLFTAVRRYHLAGLIWFDINRKEQWKLEGNPTGLAAFHRAAGKTERVDSISAATSLRRRLASVP